MKESYIYILSNKNRTVLYTGVTSDLSKRVEKHMEGKGSVFCKKYNVKELIYYELFTDIRDAIRREKEIKGWIRDKKLALIKSRNPEMKNLLEKGKY
jgi:putative endonuclease